MYSPVSFNNTSSYNYGSYSNFDFSGTRRSESYYRTKTKEAAIAAENPQPYQVKGLGEELSSLVSKLTSKSPTSSLNKMVARSSDTELVTFDNSKSTATSVTANKTIQVDQIAKAQVNSGEALKSTDKDVLSSSTGNPYKFEISVGGKTSSFSVEVNYTDDNASIQSKMAKAINDAGIGVTASVETKTGTSKLSVTAKDTGISTNGDFIIKDTNGGGNLAAKMGITSKSQSAQNAIYRIGNENGTSFAAAVTSTSNTVDIGNGIKATLKGASDKAVNVTYGKESSVGVDAVKDFVKSLNSILSTTGADSGRGSSRLANDIKGMTKAYSASLARVGLDVKSDGSIQVDEKKLTQAADKIATDPNSLQSLFQDGYGFARRVSTLADNMKSGSLYANPVQTTRNSGKNYTNPYANASFLFDMSI